MILLVREIFRDEFFLNLKLLGQLHATQDFLKELFYLEEFLDQVLVKYVLLQKF